jgi:hypothetical protein
VENGTPSALAVCRQLLPTERRRSAWSRLNTRLGLPSRVPRPCAARIVRRLAFAPSSRMDVATAVLSAVRFRDRSAGLLTAPTSLKAGADFHGRKFMPGKFNAAKLV